MLHILQESPALICTLLQVIIQDLQRHYNREVCSGTMLSCCTDHNERHFDADVWAGSVARAACTGL